MDDGGSLTAITAHCRHLVVSRALCDEIGDEPLGAVITHGLDALEPEYGITRPKR